MVEASAPQTANLPLGGSAIGQEHHCIVTGSHIAVLSCMGLAFARVTPHFIRSKLYCLVGTCLAGDTSRLPCALIWKPLQFLAEPEIPDPSEGSLKEPIVYLGIPRL